MKILSHSDILALVQSANIFSWSRPNPRFDQGRIDITVDDIPNDIRHCYSITLNKDGGYGSLRNLSGYDAKKNVWAKEVGYFEIAIQGKVGRKALLAFVKEKAVQKTGFPNPQFFTIFKETTV